MDKQDCNVPGCKDHFIDGPTTTHFCGRGVMERMRMEEAMDIRMPLWFLAGTIALIVTAIELFKVL